MDDKTREYVRGLSPMAGIIGEEGDEQFMLFSPDLRVIYQTNDVWTRTRANFSATVKGAMKAYGFVMRADGRNFYAATSVINYVEAIELRAKYLK
jgi:hypothetical protein